MGGGPKWIIKTGKKIYNTDLENDFKCRHQKCQTKTVTFGMKEKEITSRGLGIKKKKIHIIEAKIIITKILSGSM